MQKSRKNQASYLLQFLCLITLTFAQIKTVIGKDKVTHPEMVENLQNWKKAALNLHTPCIHQPLVPPCNNSPEGHLWIFLGFVYVPLQLPVPPLSPRQLYILLKFHRPHKPPELLLCSSRPVIRIQNKSHPHLNHLWRW